VFAAPDVQDMAGHLMIYPYQIDENGAVTYLGSEMIPDTKTARVRDIPGYMALCFWFCFGSMAQSSALHQLAAVGSLTCLAEGPACPPWLRPFRFALWCPAAAALWRRSFVGRRAPSDVQKPAFMCTLLPLLQVLGTKSATLPCQLTT